MANVLWSELLWNLHGWNERVAAMRLEGRARSHLHGGLLFHHVVPGVVNKQWQIKEGQGKGRLEVRSSLSVPEWSVAGLPR